MPPLALSSPLLIGVIALRQVRGSITDRLTRPLLSQRYDSRFRISFGDTTYGGLGPGNHHPLYRIFADKGNIPPNCKSAWERQSDGTSLCPLVAERGWQANARNQMAC